MLTITDIKNINFRKVNLGGYRPEDVDEFIDEVIVSYDQLLKDNAELTKKVEELNQKIDAYRADEDNIRAALMNAQKLGEASIRESKHKSDIILKDAAVKSERIVANAQREVAKQEEMVDSLKRQISNFKNRLMMIYREHMNLIDALPETEDEDEKMERNRPIDRTTRITDVIDMPSESLYEKDEDEDEEEDISFSRSNFIMPDLEDEDEPEQKPAPKSNIEEVVNPFHSFLSGQNFPVSPVSFGDKESEESKSVKKDVPKAKEHTHEKEKPRGDRDSRKPERLERDASSPGASRSRPHKDEDDANVRPPKRRDRGSRRSMAMDMADQEEALEMPVNTKREAKPPKSSPSPSQKPPRDQDEDESRFGKLKFGPDYMDEQEDDGENIPMGMFRRRR